MERKEPVGLSPWSFSDGTITNHQVVVGTDNLPSDLKSISSKNNRSYPSVSNGLILESYSKWFDVGSSPTG